jgi:hypothetical protein
MRSSCAIPDGGATVRVVPVADAEIVIRAPLERVWAIMTDLPGYARWNPFIVEVGCDAAPALGVELTLHVAFASGSRVKSRERFTVIEPPANGRARLDYVFCGPLSTLGLVRAVRTQTLEALPDGSTRYATREPLTGLLSFAVPIAGIRDGFARHAAALKAACEGALPAAPR